MEMTASIDPFATGVLRPETHGRLVADIKNVAADAAIALDWLWTPLAESVSEDEVTWVKRFRFHVTEGEFGLVLTGKADGVEDRMSAIAGALVRNFIRAQVITLGRLLDLHESGDTPKASVLLVPNFFVGKAGGATLPNWKITALHDILLDRQMKGKQTVLYVSDQKAMAAEYGTVLAQFIASRYASVDID